METIEFFAILKQLDETYIPFPAFDTAANTIIDNVTLFKNTGIAHHLLVLGESGTGKSSLCRWMVAKYPKAILPEGDVIPALSISVPPAATISSVAEAMLAQLGDPTYSRGSVTHKTLRVITLCRNCGVGVVLFDEAQHIHDRGQAATHYKVGDWLKGLIDDIKVPTVFLGLPRLVQLLQINDQLRRRFSKRLNLALGQADEVRVDTECLQLFMSLGKCLPYRISPGDYSWPEFGKRLYYASDARVAYLKKLLVAAFRMACENGELLINPELLARAFTDDIWWQGVGALNPFHQAFVFRHLDRGNEPFEVGNLALQVKTK